MKHGKTLTPARRLLMAYMPPDPVIRCERQIQRSSELHRDAELAERNQRRVVEWAKRVCRHEGRWPQTMPSGLWRRMLKIRRERARILMEEQHGNANIVPFPRHKRQIVGASYPTGPEAA